MNRSYAYPTKFNKVYLTTLLENFLSMIKRNKVANKMHIPCPQSPNMTAKRNGNVMMVYTPGLASWYLATLHYIVITLYQHNFRKENLMWK